MGWTARLKERFRTICRLDEPPARLALAFAIGVFIGFSPWFGLHTVSILLLAWVFRVNKMIALAGTFVNNPWTIVPIYGGSLWFGLWLTGGPATDMDAIPWKTLSFSDFFLQLAPYFYPFVAGTLLLGAAAALLTYPISLYAVRSYRRIPSGSSANPEERP